MHNKIYFNLEPQRIRASIFPETLEDGGNKQIQLSPRISKPSAVQRLAAPSQMLKTAVLDQIKYVDDAITAQIAFPEILKLLQREQISRFKILRFCRSTLEQRRVQNGISQFTGANKRTIESNE